jgi:hypothetical protein
MTEVINNQENSHNLNNEDEKQSKFLNQINLSLCKLIISDKSAHGFFIKFDKGNIPFYCLITNEFIKKENIISNEIEIIFGQESKIIKINDKEKSIQNFQIINNINLIDLIEKERYIFNYSFLGGEITVIEILNKDNINKDYFLALNYEFIDNCNNLINKTIDYPQIINENEINYSKSEIKSIKQYEFIFSGKEILNSVGYPVFLDGTITVLGIIYNQEKYNNFGYLIFPIINSLKNNYIIKGKKDYDLAIYEGEFKNGKREGHGKFTNRDGSYYYVGQWLNDKMNGKGKLYDYNNNIIYDGDFVNDQTKGDVKIIVDGFIYIGQVLNNTIITNTFHGKGKLYYPNNTLKYEGDFVNGGFEGKGKHIFPNGNYYIGQYKGSMQNGKGILYYKNGKIKYEGDFKNNVPDGNGKYIWENGNYYIGSWIKGVKHGKGKLYYENNNIKYDGEYKMDLFDGYGKYIEQNGEYFIGQWSNGMKVKGTIYSKDNKVLYEGDFIY